MAERKIFAGPRVRRVRLGLGLTQTAMAEALGISPSYLNLIERNQRPLTVQLLLKLASVYKVDLDALQGEGGGLAGRLREVFADPLLAGEIPGDQEIIEVAEAAPNAALGLMKLYRAYREQAARLSDLAELLAREGHETSIAGTRLPIDEVRETLERRPNFFARIEDAAETFAARLGTGDELPGALKAWAKNEHGIVVRTLPVHAMPNLRRRYDRHSMRLFLSERLSPFDRTRELAMEVALLALGREIAAELEDLNLSANEARRIGRFELARYAAHALMMPYGAFLAAAQRARYDLDVLRSRFDVSFEQAANRPDVTRAAGRAWHSVFPDGTRPRRQCNPPRRRPRLPAGPFRRALSEAWAPFRLPPAGPGPRRSGRNAGWRDVPDIVEDARRPSSGVRRADPAHCDPSRLRSVERGRHRLWRGPAGERGDDACRHRLPALRKTGLPLPCRTAGHQTARSGRDGNRPQRLRFPMSFAAAHIPPCGV
jgi:transcriptional regulator with XRE-family HTH domain